MAPPQIRMNRSQVTFLRDGHGPIRGQPKPHVDSHCGSFFLDSGAHSLYSREVINKRHAESYNFYTSQAFWDYVDTYAAFVKANIGFCDYYANVDVIFNPEMSWEVQQYMENEHGLTPVPVVHFGTDLKWVTHYIEHGYTLIGLGGLGQEVMKHQYYSWADRVYDLLCDNQKRLPCVRTHGFAMTAWELLFRYPWWSVDSASWTKAGGFGMIYVPRREGRKFAFTKPPFTLAVSASSPASKRKDRHITSLSKADRRVVLEWLEMIDVPLGKVDAKGDLVKWGVVSHHAARKIANLLFYETMIAHLPEWPWPFTHRPRRGFFK